MSALIVAARTEAYAVTDGCMNAVGYLARRDEIRDGRRDLRQQLIHESLAEARAALSRLDAICRAASQEGI